jgi:GntR family transcriptional regulator
MFDGIDPRSPTPLYDQIATRVRIAVAAGELKAGESLPSVRQLANRLRVNPATVVQAYRMLEGEGFVELKQGAGTFVREVASNRRAATRGDQARRLVREMLGDAARLGISAPEIGEALRQETGVKGP